MKASRLLPCVGAFPTLISATLCLAAASDAAPLRFAGAVVGTEAFAPTNALLNGDFEAPSILGPGQTEVGSAESKALFGDPSLPDYPNGIAGIPAWINSFTDVGFGAGFRDAGISRIDFAGSGETRYAFINNWDTRLSQVLSTVILPGYDLFFTESVGALGGGKGGRLQIWAGAPLSDNPDEFPPTAVLLGETTFGTPDWTGFVPDVQLTVDDWTEVSVHVRIPLSGPALGQPITVSMLTSGGSLGAVAYDNAALFVVPEPASFALMSVLLLTARRRSARA